jgi:hypothetical protein
MDLGGKNIKFVLIRVNSWTKKGNHFFEEKVRSFSNNEK